MKKNVSFAFFAIIAAFILSACGNSNLTSSTNSSARQQNSPQVRSGYVPATLSAKYKKGELLVKFKTSPTSSDSIRRQLNQSVGATTLRRYSLFNAEQVKLPDNLSVKDAIGMYMQNPAVEYAEPNYIKYPKSTIPNDQYFNPQQWALNNTGYGGGTAGDDIKMPLAWDITRGNGNIVIAVIDSGIDYNHPDLVNNIWANPGEPNCASAVDADGNGYAGDCRGWNFAYNDVNGNGKCDIYPPDDPQGRVSENCNDPMDDFGHGTHVAGIIGAAGNNGVGISGVMWNARLMALKFIGNFGKDFCGGDGFCGTEADEIAAIQYAVNNGAKIINASFGSSAYSQAEADTIAAAGSAGVLMVAAAGNGGSDTIGDNNDLTPGYPAAYNLPNIISVAATDQNDKLASFSNFGPNSAHVAAPGVYILSTMPTAGVSSSFTSLCTGTFFAGYDFCSGTSMAAPHVAGLAGLLYSYYPDYNYSQIRAMILRYVDVLPSLAGWIQTGGRVNAYKAVSALLTPGNLTASPESSSSMRLSWTDNATGEDGYQVYRSTASGPFALVATLGPDSTSFVDGSLNSSTSYTYHVVAYNTIPAFSQPSNDASGTTTAQSADVSAGSGGGGGCTIGARHNRTDGIDAAMVIFMPLMLIFLSRHFRRKRKV